MKKNWIVILVLFSFSSYAQLNKGTTYSKEISIEYGIFASSNGSEHENLTGSQINLQTAFFYRNNIGFRTGVSSIKGLEGSSKFYSIPIYFSYRIENDWSYMSVGSLSDLILILLPRNMEFDFGTSIGYIEPYDDLKLGSTNGGPWTLKGYQVDQRFVSTLDLGMRLNYNINRFSFVISPKVNYMLSQNFKYYSEDGIDHNYTPKWFFSMGFGVAYQF
jgi:hypothetical protein